MLGTPAWAQSAGAGDPQSLFTKAQGEIAAGDFSSAAKLLESALALFEADMNSTGIAEAASDLLVCYLQLSDMGRAEQVTAQSRLALELLGDFSGAAKLTTKFSTTFRSWGEYERAANQLVLALELYMRAGDRTGEAKTHLARGLVADLLGDLPQTVLHFSRARELYQDLDDYASAALCFENEGYALYRLSQLEESLFAYQQAVYLYQRLGLKLELARTHTLIAAAYRGLDNLADAAREYEIAALIYQDEGAREDTAVTYYELGLTLGYGGHSERALASFNLAWSIWEELGQTAQLEQMLADLTVVLRNLGRGREIEQYQERLRLLREQG